MILVKCPNQPRFLWKKHLQNSSFLRSLQKQIWPYFDLTYLTLKKNEHKKSWKRHEGAWSQRFLWNLNPRRLYSVIFPWGISVQRGTAIYLQKYCQAWLVKISMAYLLLPVVAKQPVVAKHILFPLFVIFQPIPSRSTFQESGASNSIRFFCIFFPLFHLPRTWSEPNWAGLFLWAKKLSDF